MIDQLRLADELLARREIKKAEVQIAKSLRNASHNKERAHALVLRAKARLLSARPDDALDDINSAQSFEPELTVSPALMELRADAHLFRFELASVGFADRSDVATALRLYEQLIAEFPDYENLGWIYYQMGRTLLTDNRVEQAVRYFHDGLLAPSHRPALTAYCYERLAFIAFYDARDLHKALTLANKSVDTYPALEDRRWLIQVHILRSRILREMMRYEQAQKAAETALTIAGAHGDNKHVLAEVLLTTAELFSSIDGRERDVIANLQQYIQLSKKPLGVDVTWSRVYEMLGDAYFKTGQFGAAATAYQSVLQFNPYHPWEVSLHFRTARALYHLGDYERTVHAIDRMRTAARDDGQALSDYRVYDVLGNALFALGRYDDALDAYRTAIQFAPPNAENLDKIRTYHDFALELSRPVH